MKFRMTWLKRLAAATATGAVLVTFSGCQHWKMYYQKPTAQPLGSISDPIWQAQEKNAEMSDFVVHIHEFEKDDVTLNRAGETHLQNIAARLVQGQDAWVIVEQSRQTPRENTEFRFPVHTNPKLDMQRREIIVRLLGAMGVSDADQRVIVAPRLSTGYSAAAAERALRQAGQGGGGGRGFGGYFFGGGGTF